MAHASIVGNGGLKDSVIGELGDGEMVVCADGGANHLLNYGIYPNTVIGDMDSIRTDVADRLREHGNIEFIEFPPKKDFSDMELAVDHCISLGYDDIRIFGATGWRLDHTIANITLAFTRKDVTITVVDAKNRIIPARVGITELNRMKGSNVSIVALSEELVYSVKGMEYKAEELVLKAGSARGIDNVICDDEASVEVSRGRGLIIFSED